MGKTADLTFAEYTFHLKEKPQMVTAEEAGSSNSAMGSWMEEKSVAEKCVEATVITTALKGLWSKGQSRFWEASNNQDHSWSQHRRIGHGLFCNCSSPCVKPFLNQKYQCII